MSEITFTARCPDCGEKELAPEQMWLVVPNVPGHAHYDFRCDGCGAIVRKPADEATVAFLSGLIPVEANKDFWY